MRRFDYNLLIMIVGLALGSGFLLLWNQSHAHFSDVNFLMRADPHYSLLIYSVVVVFGYILRADFPFASLMLRAIGYLSLCCATILFATSAIFTTPFELQDQAFYHFDQFVGFNQLALMQAVHAQPGLNRVLELCYAALIVVLLFTPIFLALLKNEKAMYQLLMALMMTTGIGFLLYYFLPTTDPAHVMYSPYFSALQYHDVQQFLDLHQHRALHFYDSGIIGFPSFHVIWALLIVYGLWSYPFLRYVAIVFALLVSVATLSMGWHYLADVGGAVGVVALSIWWVSRCGTALCQPNPPQTPNAEVISSTTKTSQA